MENTENLKKTVFNEMHREMGAKMVPFAGFDMPVQFEGVNIEHETVRKGVGVFDVSHMGEFRAKGPKAFAFVQRCTTNDVAALTDGKVQYTCLPNGKGGIVDDMLVYRVAEDEYFMVPNAANIDKDWAWMAAVAEEMGMELGVEFVNETDQWSQLAVQGPLALKAMQKLTATTVEDMEYYTFKILEFAGVKTLSSQQQVIQVQVVAKSTCQATLLSKSTRKFSKLLKGGKVIFVFSVEVVHLV